MKHSLFQKATAVLLALVLLLATAQTAFAQEKAVAEETTSAVQDEPTTPEVPETPDEPEEPNEETEETIVARVSLFFAMYVFPVSGHSWIYVENLTDSPMTVGLYEVPVGQGVSVGTFSFSVWDGWGLYYNLEAYRENRNDNMGDCWSITLEFNRSQLEALSNTIKNYPNMWDIFIFNCMFFAFSVWNSNTDYFLIPMFLPAFGWFEVMAAGAEKGTATMYYPTADQVMRQRGTGSSAYLEPIGSKTLDT